MIIVVLIMYRLADWLERALLLIALNSEMVGKDSGPR